jgi:hypothetical protein
MCVGLFPTECRPYGTEGTGEAALPIKQTPDEAVND